MFTQDESLALSELALELIERGRWDDAAVVVHGLIEHRPDWGWGWYAAGRLALKQGHASNAVRLLESAVQRGLQVARLPLVEAWLMAGEHGRAQQFAASITGDCTPLERERLKALGVVGG